MAVRIRVYPQTGVYGANGYGGAVSAATYYNSKLSAQKQVSSLQLGYERALANEKIERVRLEERLKNPYLTTAGLGAYGAYGALGVGGLGALGGLGGLGALGTALPVTTAIPMGFGGGGQTNVTNQTSTGSGSQTVTNSNVNDVSSVQRPIVNGGWGYPASPFGGGGLLSGLLGALI